ncbi:aspartate--tRNA(Asn) ligase [Candidatus Dojkabacteria bacterium]|uniref:Aspartate--tRNA ligase n=1 Tax=Candidatus Dojkabacteria bacterium TaxID=2099670 RepID=A0A955I8F2_9BACT|nr:aspartate--tRNA(Asn) ligase [Candidatus Dojkabacteria bacterium]
MQRTISNELSNKVGEDVLVKGWLNAVRILGKISFMVIRDRGGMVQVVLEDKNEIEKVKNLQPGSIITVSGKVQEAKQAELGVEIVNPQVTVEIPVTTPLPVEYNKPELNAEMDTILDYRPLTLRNQKISSVFKIQATIVAAYREYLTSQGFTEFFGPNIISASSEGGTELFTVNYFDQEAKLSQSAQLYKQMMVGVYERVFALMKCFRAEKSATRRHLTEATQFEFEMGFIEGFEDVMDMLENTVKYIVKSVNEKNSKELKILGVEAALAPEEVSFPRITFKEALELYYKRTGNDERHEIDLSPEAERELCKYAREEFGTDFIFVTHFLRKKTAFYAHPNEVNPEVTNYFDLLCREAEIVSGGQRIHEHDMMEDSLRLKGLNPDDFRDYLAIFKFGMPKHGGFGMGMERLTMLLLGLDNIREATLFPSDTKRIASVSLKRKAISGSQLVTKIKNILDEAGVKYEYQKHAPVKTSEEAAEVRGTKIEEGLKALILKGKKSGKNIMVCLPANEKISMEKLKGIEGEAFEFEKPEVVKEKYGVEVGGVPPFGFLMGLKTYYSESVKEQTNSNFNCGTREESLTIKTSYLLDTLDNEIYWY